MHAPSHFAFAPASRKHGTGPVLAPSKPRLQLPRSSVFHGFRAKQEESDTEAIPEATLTCPTDAFFYNVRTTTGPSSIDSLQRFAHPPALPPFALLRFVRRAASPEIQSVEETENVPPGCQTRLLLQRQFHLFSALRNCCTKDASSLDRARSE